MITLILFLTLFFTLLIILIFAKLSKLFAKKTTLLSEKVSVSVIIAAKNEEKNIIKLLSSIEKINYPKEKFEVIIADDNSTDLTYQITKDFIKEKPNYSLIKPKDKKYNAKRGALQACIENAKYDYFAVTDADCEVSADWLNYLSSEFVSGYDFIFGPGPFYQRNGFINNISCYENLRSTLLNLFFYSLRLPFSTSARNFGFQRKSFDEIGGFSHTLQTISGDDDLLLREAHLHKQKISFFHGKDSHVFSETSESLRDYIRQRSRHTQTSFHYLPKHQLALLIWHVSNIIIISSPFLIIFSPVFLLPFFIKIVLDICLVKYFEVKLLYKFPVIKLPVLIVSYEFFIILNFFTSLNKKSGWK